MLTFSQSIRAWLEFQRCTNAVLTMAGRPDSRRYWNARDAVFEPAAVRNGYSLSRGVAPGGGGGVQGVRTSPPFGHTDIADIIISSRSHILCSVLHVFG